MMTWNELNARGIRPKGDAKAIDLKKYEIRPRTVERGDLIRLYETAYGESLCPFLCAVIPDDILRHLLVLTLYMLFYKQYSKRAGVLITRISNALHVPTRTIYSIIKPFREEQKPSSNS